MPLPAWNSKKGNTLMIKFSNRYGLNSVTNMITPNTLFIIIQALSMITLDRRMLESACSRAKY